MREQINLASGIPVQAVLKAVGENFRKLTAQAIQREERKLLSFFLTGLLGSYDDAAEIQRVLYEEKKEDRNAQLARLRFIGFSTGLVTILQKKLSAQLQNDPEPLSEGRLMYIREHADAFVSVSRKSKLIGEVVGKISAASVDRNGKPLLISNPVWQKDAVQIPDEYFEMLASIAIGSLQTSLDPILVGLSPSAGGKIVPPRVDLIVREVTKWLYEGQNAAISRIQQLVPEQKIAPASFDVRDGRIVVARERSETEPEDHQNAEVARSELLQSGERLLANLRTSNCDPRLIQDVEYLHRHIAANENIVRVGIANLKCEAAALVYKDELPEALIVSLVAYSRGVDMYAAQYPDWERFLENVARTQMDDDDTDVVRQGAKELAKELERRPDLADPEVPRILNYIAEIRATPGKAAKRAAFAIIRTVGNLLSKTFSYAAEIIGGTLSAAKDELKKPLGKALAYTLLALALQGAASVGPVAGKINEMKWLQDVRTLIEAHLKVSKPD
jgi:hypothetical protein